MIISPISRPEFCDLIPAGATMLEIGPYAKPVYRRPRHDVYYADMYSIEQIRQNVSLFGHNDNEMPDTIHIVMDPAARPTFQTDLKVDYIFSSHNIEHIPDIINHLQEAATLAASKDTKYHLAIPDKRYCFDHWQALTHFPKMIHAYHNRVVKNTYQSVLENTVFMSHNESGPHWQGFHGEDPFVYPAPDHFIEKIKQCMTKADAVDTEYVDTHNWQFIPASFFYNIDILTKLDLIPWKVNCVYETAQGSNEFFAILELR